MASVSDRLLFEKNQPSVPTQSMITTLYPTSGKDVQAGQKIVIEIPTGGGAPGQNLVGNMSYLMFNYKNLGSAICALPYGGVKSLFEKVELFSAGKLVHSLDKYADWNALLLDIGTNVSDASGLEAFTTGQKDTLGSRSGAQVASGGERTFVCELPSMILNQHKHIPTYALTGGLRLEITLASNLNGGVWTSADTSPGWEIKNFQANLQYSNVSAEAHRLIAGENGANIEQSLSLWETFHDMTIQDGSTGYSALIPCRKNSIKTICSTFKQASAPGQDDDCLSRFNLGVTSYNYVVNGKNAPVVPVTGNTTNGRAQMAMELARAFHKVSGVKKGRISGLNYQVADNRKQNCTFAIAVDLEGTPNKSNSSFSGVNTVSSPPQLQASFTDPGGSVETIHHVHYDAVMSISNGMMSIAY